MGNQCTFLLLNFLQKKNGGIKGGGIFRLRKLDFFVSEKYPRWNKMIDMYKISEGKNQIKKFYIWRVIYFKI